LIYSLIRDPVWPQRWSLREVKHELACLYPAEARVAGID
jgi:hypothetical protein